MFTRKIHSNSTSRVHPRWLVALFAGLVFWGTAFTGSNQAVAQDFAAPTGGNVAMFDQNGQFVYAITGLFQTTFLDANVIGGWGTDLQTMQYVAIVPTAQPNVFVYVVAPEPGGTQAGSAGTFKIHPDGSITWKNNRGQSGTAVAF